MVKREIRLGSMFLVVMSFCAHADQNGTCEMDGGKKAHYYCPEGYEVMLAGGGKEDCSGRCYKKGSADDLKKAIMGVMKYDFHTTISDEKAAYIANEMLKTGTSTAMTNGGKSITLTKEKAHD